MIDCHNLLPNSNIHNQTPSQLVTGDKHLDLQHVKIYFLLANWLLSEIPNKTWKLDLKNDVTIYLGHPKGTVNTTPKLTKSHSKWI